jgi:8-oxo-dGTP diphosphatase
MNYFNDREFKLLCEKYGGGQYVREVTISTGYGPYFKSLRDSVASDRRGEVVFGVIREGRIVTIRSDDYPPGVFRVPTGGISYGEDIENALLREIKEELGLDARILTFEGVIKFIFTHLNEKVEFYSYVFLLEDTGGRLIHDATDNEISEAKLATASDLEQVMEKLLQQDKRWLDWARFRYETTKAVCTAFVEMNKKAG